jgi:hypothetical protein
MILQGNTPVSLMKSKTMTGCVVLTALAAIILMSWMWKRKPSDSPPHQISTQTQDISRSDVMLAEGDPAPKLSVSKWIQGEPITAFEPGTAYLVEFWTSWWIPSKEPMVRVNRLHQKYKDKGLVVIGQNVKESSGTNVEAFIKRMGPLMSYRVALDEGATNRLSGKMLENWLFTAEQGVPAAFIIDKKGIISFIGHPDEIEEELIEQVLAGTFDPKKRALDRKSAAAKAEAWETHNELGRAAWNAKQWDKAMSEIDQMEKLFPHKRPATECLRMTVFIRKDDLEAASKLAIQLSDDRPDDPYLQHRIARTIASQARTKYRIEGFERDLLHEGAANSIILKTANLVIERAISLMNGPEPEFLHTQAQLAFLREKENKPSNCRPRLGTWPTRGSRISSPMHWRVSSRADCRNRITT